MRDARTQIARGIDGITRGAAERKPNSPHQTGNQIYRQKSWRWTIGKHQPRIDRTNNKYQNKSGNDFTQQVWQKVADRRRGAKAPKFSGSILRLTPMRKILQPHEHRS